MALMTKLINSEPSRFGEAAQYDVWQEAMVEEYDSIMKNQVREVVPRSQGKKVCYQPFCTIVGLPEEPSVDKHVQCLIPVYQLIRLCV